MQQYEITRAFHIDTGHRIYGHEGKCACLHGHRYQIQVTLRAIELDAIGRVLDFGVMKEKIGRWLEVSWDHGLVLWGEDPLVGLFGVAGRSLLKGDEETGQAIMAALNDMKLYVMDCNPTAENMAQHLLYEVIPELLGANPVICTRVVVMETPNCWATADLAATLGDDGILVLDDPEAD